MQPAAMPHLVLELPSLVVGHVSGQAQACREVDRLCHRRLGGVDVELHPGLSAALSCKMQAHADAMHSCSPLLKSMTQATNM